MVLHEEGVDMPVDLSSCREQFPAMSCQVNGNPVAYFDGPGGTQVPKSVIDRMVRYLSSQNANIHGEFKSSRETDAVIEEARERVAVFLGASKEEIAFGANMTTLNFALSRAIARDLVPGDEIIVTELDHEANIGPWTALSEKGIRVLQVRVDTESCTLDMADLESKLGPRTKVVAVTYTSNAVGTINDVKRIAAMAHEVGAVCVVDAVSAAPHILIDVRDIDCDYLLCSAYKFFGPHVGVLYGKREKFRSLRAYKVRPQEDFHPEKIETGTLNHEGLAGTTAAIDFIASLGEPFVDEFAPGDVPEERGKIIAAMRAMAEYEDALLARLMDGLSDVPGLKIYGLPAGASRTPIVAFTMEGCSPAEVARELGEKGLFVWHGHFFALTLIERLGLAEKGGVVRIGIAPYNTAEEIDRLLEAIRSLASGR